MAGKVEYKKPTDLVKLVNTGEQSVGFSYDSVSYNLASKESRVMARQIAEHGIDKNQIPQKVKDDKGNATIVDYKCDLIIDELPYEKRSQESLAQSAEEAKQLTGEVDTLNKVIAEQKETIDNLTQEIARLRSDGKKGKK